MRLLQSYRLLFGLFLACSIAIIVIWSITPSKYQKAKRYYTPDRRAQSAIYYIVKRIYEYSGRRVTSFDELSKTQYFPYSNQYKTYHSGTLYIYRMPDLNGVEVGLDLSQANSEDHSALKIRRSLKFSGTPEGATRRLMKICISGVSKHFYHVNQIRSLFLEVEPLSSYLSRGSANSKTMVKPSLNKPIPRELPANEADLKAYLNWLCKIEAVDVLRDGWNHPFKILIRGGKLVIRSAGADGKFGTKDDIVMTTNTGVKPRLKLTHLTAFKMDPPSPPQKVACAISRHVVHELSLIM